MNKSFYTIIISVMLFPVMLFSQIKMTGKIINKDNIPLENIEIFLLNKDSISIKSELTNSNGEFVMSIEKGYYTLGIRKFGVLLWKKKIELNQDLNLEIIRVNDQIQNLSEVIVKGKKKLIERKVDRLVFNVENSISASGGDAIDALKITPNLRLQNDKITMVGKSNMSIMIDDRLIELFGDDLINFLRTIKSENIKSIEVITAPPAKYDAEGNSGIVNIKLKKAKKDRISGNIMSSYTQAKYGSNSIGGGLNYQKNKTTITSNIDYSNGKIAPYQEYTINYPNYTWFEKNKKIKNSNDLNTRITLDHQITPKTSIGLEYIYNYNNPKYIGINNSVITNSSINQIDSLIVTPSNIVSNKKNNSLNFHSISKLDTIGKTISFDVDYFNFKSDLNNDFSSNSFYSNGQVIPKRLNAANTLSNQNITVYSSKINVEMPLKWIDLSFGSKISFINNNSDIEYYNTINILPVFDPTKSNRFNYKENTQALFLTGTKKLSEKLEIQLGLRAEATQTSGFSVTLNQLNKNNYIKIYPTFYLAYTKNENSTFSFTYNRRIDRPSYRELNPFRFYSTSYNYSEGNPFLQPYFSQNLDITNTYKNLSSTLFYSYKTNGFDEVTFVSKNNNVQAVIPYNFYKQNTVGIAENYTLSKWKWLESNNSFNVFYIKTTSNIENTIPKISNWTASYSTNNSIKLNKNNTIKAEINFMYQSPSVAGSYKLSSYYELESGLRFLILAKKINLTINFSDILKSNKQIFTQIVNDIKQENYNYNDTQKIRFSLTYNFGKSFEKEKREQSNEEEKERIK
jgi:hypothetical protein